MIDWRLVTRCCVGCDRTVRERSFETVTENHRSRVADGNTGWHRYVRELARKKTLTSFSERPLAYASARDSASRRKTQMGREIGHCRD
jgi:hypothetical protein